MAGIQLFKDALKETTVKWLIRINLGLITFLVILIFMSISHPFLRTDEELTTEASKRDFCALSMKQMIKHKLSSKLVKDGLYQLITKDNYAALLLKGNEILTGVWSNDVGCKVLLRTDEGLGSFDFILEQSSNFKYFYQIQKIVVNELFDKETN